MFWYIPLVPCLSTVFYWVLFTIFGTFQILLQVSVMFYLVLLPSVVRVTAWTYCSCSGGLVTWEERKVRSGRKAVGGGL